MIRSRLFAVPLLAVAFSYAEAQPPSIQPLGVLDAGDPVSQAQGVSANGATVVGESNVGGNRHAFRWRAATGMVDLGTLEPGGSSSALDVSDNGQVVVGEASTGGLSHAFRWTQTGGMKDLGTIDGAATTSGATAVSANGAVVVGNSGNASGGESPFRWTNGSGMVDLGSFAGPFGFAVVSGVSGNGSVVVGYSGAPASQNRLIAFRWQAGAMENVSLANHPISAVTCISGDGRFMGGINSTTLKQAGYRTSRWTPNGAVQKFGPPATSIPYGMSLDGQVLAGVAILETAGDPVTEATIWIGGKPQPLSELLASEDVDLSDWSALNFAYAVSANGRVVVGVGTLHPDDRTMAFRAVLPNRAPRALTPKVTNVVRKATTTRVTLAAKTLDPDSPGLVARWRVDGKHRKTQKRVPGQTTALVFDYANGDTPVSLSVTDGNKSATLAGIVRVTAASVRFIKSAAGASEAAPAPTSLAANGSSLDAYRLSGLAVVSSAGVASSASGASLSGYRYAESAIRAESYADESDGVSGLDGSIAQRQLRYAQAVYSRAAASRHLQAYAESGDEAQLSAAMRWETAALEALGELAD